MELAHDFCSVARVRHVRRDLLLGDLAERNLGYYRQRSEGVEALRLE
jgi:hypothetical protein